MAKTTVELEILAEVREATKSINKFAKESQAQLDSLNTKSGATAIATSFLAISQIAGQVFGAVKGFINDSINEALEAEKANVQLAQSLKLVGDFSEDAIKQYNEFADALEETTTLQGEQIIAAAALAKSYNLTNKEAKNVVAAAVELSAVTGQDLNSSVQSLAKTFNGFVSKELKQLAPELKGLTKAQLEAGDAAKIINERFKGTAEALKETAGGSISELSKAYSNLQEAIGDSIIKNGLFIESLNKMTSVIKNITGLFKNTEESAKKISNAFDAFVDPAVVAEAEKSFKRIQDAQANFVDDAIAAQKKLRSDAALNSVATSQEKRIQDERKFIREREQIEKDFQSIRASVELAGLSEIEKINRDAAKKIEILRKAQKAGVDSEGLNFAKAIAQVQIEAKTKVLEIEKKQTEEQKKRDEEAKKVLEDRKSFIAELTNKPVEGLIKFGAELDSQAGFAIGLGLLKNVTKGVEGARSLISEGIGAAADTLIPGIGGAVSSIVSELSKGPEAAKSFVTEFVNGIPEIIDNLVEALPVLIASLAEKLPPALAKTFPFLAQRFAIEIVNNMPTIIKGFVNGMIEAAKQFGQELIDTIKDSFNIFGGGEDGGGIPILSDIGDFLGLAKGGSVPDSARFRGDKFGPVMLDGGEEVLNRDLSRKLESFLSRESISLPNISIQLMTPTLEQYAKIQLQADRLNYRTRFA